MMEKMKKLNDKWLQHEKKLEWQKLNEMRGELDRLRNDGQEEKESYVIKKKLYEQKRTAFIKKYNNECV